MQNAGRELSSHIDGGMFDLPLAGGVQIPPPIVGEWGNHHANSRRNTSFPTYCRLKKHFCV